LPTDKGWIDTEPPSGLETTATLLMRVRTGEAAAREQLATRYLASLRRWAHGRLPASTRDLVDTDDLVQTTLMRALNRAREFEPRREGAFVAYIRQILLNQIRDEARRGRRRPEHVELTGEVEAKDRSLLDQGIGRQNMENYELALAKLPERQREAVILRVEMGYRYREIAEAMDLDTANGARKLVARGLVQLAEIMRGHDGT